MQIGFTINFKEMKRKVFYLTVISCLLFAGQIWAQQPFDFLKKYRKPLEKTSLRNSSTLGELPVFSMRSGTMLNAPAGKQVSRPTTIYQKSTLGSLTPYFKFECSYDKYGHITLLKHYYWDGLDYVLKSYTENEYHQLPNSEFVKTKEEYYELGNEYFFRKKRYTSDYDNKGMLLWYKNENFNVNTSDWYVSELIEARIENGVRTAMLYNGEVDNRYAFDHKGRIIRNDKNNNYTGISSISYTWNDNDRLIEIVINRTIDNNGNALPDTDDPYIYTYRNIEIVHNEKYFNPYSLDPLGLEENSDNNVDVLTEVSWGDFSVDDYTLHEVCYNLDVTGIEANMEFQNQVRTTINNAGKQIVRTATIQASGIEISSATMTTDVLDEYGSYHRLINEGDNTFEYLVRYNAYGELLQNCKKLAWEEDGNEYLYENDYIYTHEYDNLERPVKTIYSRRYKYNSDTSEYSWEETYDAWTTIILLSSIAQETVANAISIYPNPVEESIRFSGIEGEANITLSDVDGRVLLHRSIDGKEAVSVSHLPAGVYFINIQINGSALTSKFIKK
jgi:hypothetical protein